MNLKECLCSSYLSMDLLLLAEVYSGDSLNHSLLEVSFVASTE